jgi:hypothetical protein
MAKRSTSSVSGLNTTAVIILVIGVVVGFVAGFLIARERYTDKIAEISKMNMDKAVTIDDLHRQIDVLGVSTEAAH